MIEFGKEYFDKPYYFYLKDRGDKISVYYSVSDTITESRKKDEKLTNWQKKESFDLKGGRGRKGFKIGAKKLKMATNFPALFHYFYKIRVKSD